MKEPCSFKTLGTKYPVSQSHIPEEEIFKNSLFT